MATQRNRRRKLKQGATYHVGCKINRDEIIFKNDTIKERFLNIVKRCKEKYSFDLYDFLIRGNHFYFMIHPKKGSSLPRIMQWINSVFAKTYNKMMGVSGRLWKERYFSVIIETKQQFEITFEYIVNNPVAAKLVKHARDYRYGGLYYYLHQIDGIIDIRERFIQDLYERCRNF
ncbi:MAG: transposase [Treponema sp.]|jgi:REP element-mobilizing transposase RayT|nr:transposase [Treponema sp.]